MELTGLATAVTGITVIVTVAGVLLGLVALGAAVTVLAPHRRARLRRQEGLRDYWGTRFHHASHA